MVVLLHEFLFQIRISIIPINSFFYFIADQINASTKTVDDWLANLHADPAPFVPQPHNDTDTAYFEARNNMQEWKISQFIDNVG